MANLGKKNGTYLARFRYQGKEYKKSLKTTERKTADAAMHRIEDALHRLTIGTLTIPEGVDPGSFILSGGTVTAKQTKTRTEHASAVSTGGNVDGQAAIVG